MSLHPVVEKTEMVEVTKTLYQISSRELRPQGGALKPKIQNRDPELDRS